MGSSAAHDGWKNVIRQNTIPWLAQGSGSDLSAEKESGHDH